MRIKEKINEIDGDLNHVRKKLRVIDARASKHYFQEVFKLFDKRVRPEKRKTFQAYDGINNTFNLAYELLFWKCYRSLSKAHLETHLGFIHSLMSGRPSLVCDFQELYRYLIDDFLIEYSKSLKPQDFIAKTETINEKKGKRTYLNKRKTRELTKKLHNYFRHKVSIPRIKHGNRQEIESLINEEALLLAKYLRNERTKWIPRIVELEGAENRTFSKETT